MNVAILPNNFYDSEIIYLPHPRNGIQSPFVIFQNKIFEVLEVSFSSTINVTKNSSKTINCKSFFVGSNVISNGRILFVSRMHPILIIIPLLIKRKNEFFPYDKYFENTPYITISQYVYPYFTNFGIYEDLNDQKYWSFDDSKLLAFLEAKFERMSDYFRIYYDSTQRIHERSFDIFRHYLPTSYLSHFRNHISQKYPESFPNNIFTNIYLPNKMVASSNNDDKAKSQKKIPKFTFKRKKIPKYLENNRVITSFFKPQKILA